MLRKLIAGLRGIEWTFSLLLILFIIAFLVWSMLFDVDQTVRTGGQVIAVSRTQVVQAVDGGVVSEILVQEGQEVRAGQAVAIFERDRSNASYEESRAKEASLAIALARASAEAHDRAPVFDRRFKDFPEFVQAQRNLYEQKRRSLQEDMAALQDSLSMAQQELDMNENLYKVGDTSRLEVMRARRQVLDLQARLQAIKNKYLQDARAEAAKLSEDLSSSRFRLEAQRSVLEHTTLVSPVDGVVKLLRVTSIGGVLRPGEELMQISPSDSEFVVEAKVSPSDVGLLRLGQLVKIKLDAYDYSIYGMLDGELSYISPDTMTDASSGNLNAPPPVSSATGAPASAAYYRVRVRVHNNGMNHPTKLSVKNLKQGMTASLDIVVGSRSVFGYLAKPVLKAFTGAMSEK